MANRQAAKFGFVLADLEEVVAAAVGNRKDLVAIGVQCVGGHQRAVQDFGIVAQSLTRHVQLAMRAITLLLRLVSAEDSTISTLSLGFFIDVCLSEANSAPHT